MMTRQFFIFLGMLLSSMVWAQKDITTVGFQIKPTFTSSFIGTGPQNISDSSFNYSIKPGTGYVAGMIIRKGYTPSLSIEFGLNYVVRNTSISASYGTASASNKLRIVGYEIPFSQLIFIRLSNIIYMNAGAGACLNMFPSDVFKRDSTFSTYGSRSMLFNPSLLANIGFEFRTYESGYFYIGASLNRPFSEIYQFKFNYLNQGILQNAAYGNLNGAYLALDFKYFFHEDPEKKKKRLEKKQNNPNK
jgi:hypothetical protein